MRYIKQALFITTLFFAAGTKAQVGIGIATPNTNAILDLTATDKGLLIPRVSLIATNVTLPIAFAPPLPASLLVYNTATNATSGAALAVTPGYYYWNGAWTRLTDNGWINAASAATTNYTTGTRFLGTANASDIDLVTAGIVRGRLSNQGQFLIGTTSATRSGDLMDGVSNASFPWAINGYSSFNGAGVYGAITGGTTQFAGVEGEYSGTGTINTAAIRGVNKNTIGGTGFRVQAATGPRMGVYGTTSVTSGNYTFGVYGSFLSNSPRGGGVMGNDPGGGAFGSLAYYSTNGNDYSLYGFGLNYTLGDAGGRGTSLNTALQSLDTNTHIGIGVYGGMMGGWVRGLKYGFNTKGETYSMYIDGKGYTNEPLAYLAPTATDERVASYMVTSMQTEVNSKGRVMLQGGKVYVPFKEDYTKVISGKEQDIMITATPQGNSGGVYVDKITAQGFWIIENNNGTSTVPVVWMATAVATEQPKVAPELLNKDFDKKMDKVMFNDNNTKDTPQNMWWDGTKMRWDAPPPRKAPTDVETGGRQQRKG